MSKDPDQFDHYMVCLVERYADLGFVTNIAVRLSANLTPKKQKVAIEEYVAGWRDSYEEVSQIEDKSQWTGPSGVVVELKSFKRIAESTWFLLREEQLAHTVCL